MNTKSENMLIPPNRSTKSCPSNKQRRIWQIALLCVLVSHFASLTTVSAGNANAVQLYEQVVDSTVWVVNVSEECTGTGWVIDAEQGLVVTNHHVVGTSVDVVVCLPAKDETGRFINSRDFYRNNQVHQRTATVVASDPVRDLAVLHVQDFPESRVSLPLATNSASPGESIVSVGNPGVSEGLWVFTRGEVRNVCEQTGYRVEGPVKYRVLESSSAINSGDSGGPAVNENGEIVGVSTAYRKDGRLVSLFIDVMTVRTFFQEVKDLVDPVTSAQFVKRGSLHSDANRFPSAMADYNQALRLQSDCSEALAGRGRCFRMTGDQVSARADYEDALAVDPQNPDACIGLAKLIEDSDKDRAISVLTNAIRSSQSPATMAILFGMRGKYFFEKNDFKNAISDLNRATDITPMLHAAWYYKGRILMLCEKYEPAEQLFGQAIVAASQLGAVETVPNYFFYHAGALYKLSKYEDAFSSIETAIKLQNNNADYYFLAGHILKDAGLEESSRAFFQAAEKLDPEHYTSTPVISGSWSTTVRTTRGTYRMEFDFADDGTYRKAWYNSRGQRVWTESGTYELTDNQLICSGQSGSGKNADEVCEFSVSDDDATLNLKVLKTNSSYRLNNSYRMQRSAS